MNADLYNYPHDGPAVDPHSRLAAMPGEVEGSEEQADPTATNRRRWHAPQLTEIEIKRTMASSGPGTDSVVFTGSQ